MKVGRHADQNNYPLIEFLLYEFMGAHKVRTRFVLGSSSVVRSYSTLSREEFTKMWNDGLEEMKIRDPNSLPIK